MITHVKSVTVCVRDQQKAVDFYTGKLGFTLKRDEPMGPDARWIELSPPGSQTVLVPFTPPGMEDRIGKFTGVVLNTEDAMKTFEELSAKGVKFTKNPEKQVWGGITAMFVDQDENGFVLVQE